MRKEILSVLKDFEEEFSTNKDNSRESELTFLSLYIKKQSEENQEQFKKFLLKELKTNNNEMQDWSSRILIKLNDTKLIPEIYNIFCLFYKKNNPFSEKVFVILMNMRDTDKKHLRDYYFFAENILRKDMLIPHSFNAIVEYLVVNSMHALDILSDCYSELFFLKNQKITYLNFYIFVPYLFFIKTTFDYMNQLLEITYKKEKETGIWLKRLFWDYATLTPNENKLEFENKQKMLDYLKIVLF